VERLAILSANAASLTGFKEIVKKGLQTSLRESCFADRILEGNTTNALIYQNPLSCQQESLHIWKFIFTECDSAIVSAYTITIYANAAFP
jgi:hypothetical protein